MKTCSVKDCNMKHFAFGYCRKHHARFKRHGTTDSLYDKEKYTNLGGIRDTGKGRRGSLAVNVVNDIKYKALQRGKSWELSHKEAFDMIISECSYCGKKADWPKLRVGIDRVDNTIGYTTDNCLPCCAVCNTAKSAQTFEEFIAWVKKIHTRLMD
jgi:hypothetical protein